MASTIGARTKRAALAALAALAIAVAGIACEAVPVGPPPAGDRWEVCAAPDAQAALDDASAAVAGGAYERALRLARAALDACPECMRAHLLYLDAAAAAGPAALDEARAFYAAEDDGSSPVWPYLRARFAENDESRLGWLEESLRRAPSFYWAYLSKGRMMRSLGRSQRAREALQHALSANPDFTEARVELAQLLAAMGHFEESEAEYANYVRARPTDREARREYVRLLVYELGRGDRALALVEELQREDPGDIDTLMNLAAIHWFGRRPEVARDLYREVLGLDPTAATAALNLGNLYFERLAAGSAAAKRDAWAKARKAYLYYLALGRTDSVHDLWDRDLAVPWRLRRIEAELGPDDGRPPSLDSF